MNKSFEEMLKDHGVNHRGFGKMPKYVMIAKELTSEAKAIYAYFSCFIDQGTRKFPNRDKILKDLKIGKNAYYRHYNMLIKEAYLSVSQRIIDGNFSSNIYKFNPNHMNSTEYAFIPTVVMMDSRMPIKSKAIYAYICCFAESDAYYSPTIKEILYDLKISEPTYYKHFNFLRDLGYIKVVQRTTKGVFGVNDYFLVENPIVQKSV